MNKRLAASMIGELLGALIRLMPCEEVRSAVAWWAENDAAWAAFERLKALGPAIEEMVLKQAPEA